MYIYIYIYATFRCHFSSMPDASTHVVASWERFVKSAQRIRRLQRYRSCIGHLLHQSYSSEFRLSLTSIYQKE